MNPSNNVETEETEIDLKEVFSTLWDGKWLILVTTIAGILLGLVLAMVQTPIYESTTTLYVLNKNAGNDNVTTSDLQSSNYLVNDYAALIKSRTVLEDTIAKLDLSMDTEKLEKKITVNTSADTRVMEIIVKDADPFQAQKIANAMREAASKQISTVMSVDAVNVVDEANIPSVPVSPSKTKNMMMGGALLFVLACALLLIRFFLNDRIQNAQDVEKYLGLSVLGTIPLAKGEEKKKNDQRKKAAAHLGGR